MGLELSLARQGWSLTVRVVCVVAWQLEMAVGGRRRKSQSRQKSRRLPDFSAPSHVCYRRAMAATAAPTLLEHLTASLASFPGTHTYTLQVLRSQPRRSYALFPHATNPKTRVWQEEILLLVSEDIVVPSSDDAAPTKPTLPIFALEASIYTVPSTSTALLYISKVDTTGLASPSAPSPAKTIVASFLAFHFAHPPHDVARLRVHVFAKAQDQYLFPGSVENKGKKVLSDRGLIRWWKSTFDEAVRGKDQEGMEMWYLVPGLSHADSLPYVPASTEKDAPKWNYGHPYDSITSPLFLSPPSSSSIDAEGPKKEMVALTDLIPAFPDDPKSRFLHSLTSSSIPSSGNEGDYDDLHASLVSNSFSSGTSSREQMEVERKRERERVLSGCVGGVGEWWVRMETRQECCSGTLVGFFVVAKEGKAGILEKKEEESVIAGGSPRKGGKGKEGRLEPLPSSVPHATFTKLWSQFHNVDYSIFPSPPSSLSTLPPSTDAPIPIPSIDHTNLIKLISASTKWSEDLSLVIQSEGHPSPSSSSESHATISTTNEYKKREREEVVVVVNKMVPRKKVKKV